MIKLQDPCMACMQLQNSMKPKTNTHLIELNQELMFAKMTKFETLPGFVDRQTDGFSAFYGTKKVAK